MESYIIIIGIIFILIINGGIYYFIKKNKNQKDLDDYLKKGGK
jgi:uncharacterized protein YpmB